MASAAGGLSMGKRERFADHTGTKRWEVEHPSFGRCYVTSPDPQSAMVAAAQVWGTKWTAYEFYSNCTVCKT